MSNSRSITIVLSEDDWVKVVIVLKEQAEAFSLAPWEIGDEQQVLQLARDFDRIMCSIAAQSKAQQV